MLDYSDVLIVGAGPTGLYAALLLNQMGLTVHIIDKRSSKTPSTNPSYVWSPRSLQLFQAFDLTTTLLDRGGQRHWRLETYTNKGYGSAAVTADRQNHSVWENEATEFSWSMTCECDLVCSTLTETLEDRGVQVLFGHELMDMETNPANEWVTAQIATPYETYNWNSSIIIGADGANSLVRQKLGIAYERIKSSRVFYTIEATVSTNFPSAKSMASVTKDENTVFVVGHTQNKMYISFEHRPKWSRLTIDDDLPLILAQKHVKSVLDPYQIEFTQVHAYRRWLGGGRACEEYAASRRYFLAGGAAHTLAPEGMLGADLGLEQVHNLCWKVALLLKHRGSPQLLDTYDQECRSKLSDAQSASHALFHLLSYDYSAQSANTGLNSTHNRELGYQLHRNKHGIVGETPYHANLVNINTISTLSLANSDILQVAAAAAAVTLRAQQSVQPGTPGTLAQNSKLKPYTMFNLLVSQTNNNNNNNNKTPYPPSSTNPGSTGPKQIPPPKSGTASRWKRTRSNSVTSNSSSAAARLLVPFLTIKAKRANSANGIGTKAIISTTAAAAAVAAPPSPSVQSPSAVPNSNSAMDRWRMIKTNHFRILDRMWLSSSPFAFNLLVFTGQITDHGNLALLQRFRRHLEEPHSFIQRYEKLSYPFGHSDNVKAASLPQQQQQRRQEHGNRWHNTVRSSYSSSINSSKTSLRLSSCFSPPMSPTSTNSTVRSSLDQPRPSIATGSSSNSNRTRLQSNALFSFLYITSSSRTDVSRFLNDTQPAIVHAAFPLGLDRVHLDHDQHSHTTFDIRQYPTVIVVRPDGYICTKIELQNDTDFERLDQYFDVFLRPPIDMTSAAALAADYYDL